MSSMSPRLAPPPGSCTDEGAMAVRNGSMPSSPRATNRLRTLLTVTRWSRTKSFQASPGTAGSGEAMLSSVAASPGVTATRRSVRTCCSRTRKSTTGNNPRRASSSPMTSICRCSRKTCRGTFFCRLDRASATVRPRAWARKKGAPSPAVLLGPTPRRVGMITWAVNRISPSSAASSARRSMRARRLTSALCTHPAASIARPKSSAYRAPFMRAIASLRLPRPLLRP